jgi:adenosylhomocysteinase
MPKYDVKDLALASEGRRRIEWASNFMPVCKLIEERLKKEKPLKGKRVSACLHVTTETANLMRVLQSAGADITLCASNPLSTQDDVAASLVKDFGINTFAICGVDKKGYYSHINAALDAKPEITMDDGADLVNVLHSTRRDLLPGVIGGTEETTTGVIRLKAMAANKVLEYPIVAVNDSQTKHLFDNRYGTGQSTIDGIIRATNYLIAGSVFVVAGYGWCGRGVAMRAKGLGADVIVTEVDSIKAIEAVMDGFRVMPMAKAVPLGDIFVTLTGNIHVIRPEHFAKMKTGAVVANSGHFNVELDLDGLAKISKKRRMVRNLVEEFTLPSGRVVNILGEGRLINLAAAEGHPAMVMDMSFANQLLASEYIVQNYKKLGKNVLALPAKLDYHVAALKLKSMGANIDNLTAEQKKYLASYDMGT